MAPLPPQASDCELDRQTTHQGFNSEDSPNSPGNSSSNNSTEQDSSDKEDDEPDPKFLIRSTKEKAKTNRENAKALKYSKKILSLSTSSELPHHASSLSRSIVDFVKGMIGCAGIKFRLPLPPSNEEVQQWQTWLASRQKAIHSAIDTQSRHYNVQNDAEKNLMIRNKSRELKRSVASVKYTPASTLNSKIPAPFQIACNDQFKSQGFSRITFEWNKPNLTDSEWNSATTDILSQNWYNWYLQERKFSKIEDRVNVRSAIERWLTSMKKKYSKDNKPQSAQPINNATNSEDEKDKSFRRRKLQRKKVAKLRFNTAMSLFPKQPHLSKIFMDVDTVSDYEESTDVHQDPLAIIPHWRSEVLTQFVATLDTATMQMAKPKNRNSLYVLFTRNGSRKSTEDEDHIFPIPSGLPLSSYSQEFISTCSILERRQLGIPDEDKEPYTISHALEELKKLTNFGNAAQVNRDSMQAESSTQAASNMQLDSTNHNDPSSNDMRPSHHN